MQSRAPRVTDGHPSYGQGWGTVIVSRSPAERVAECACGVSAEVLAGMRALRVGQSSGARPGSAYQASRIEVSVMTTLGASGDVSPGTLPAMKYPLKIPLPGAVSFKLTLAVSSMDMTPVSGHSYPDGHARPAHRRYRKGEHWPLVVRI